MPVFSSPTRSAPGASPSVVGKTAESLYFSCYILPGAYRLPAGLAEAREAAARSGAKRRLPVRWEAPATVWVEGPDGNLRRKPGRLSFDVKGGGSGSGYHFVLRNDDLSIEAQRTGLVESPAVYVQLRARLVWAVGYEEATRWALALVGELFGRVNESLLSRVDFTVDVQGWRFHQDDITRFVTRSRKRALHRTPSPVEPDVVYFKPKFTGVEFSRGNPVACRIYDKMAEIEANKTKTWFYDVWRDGGWDGHSRVWRVEFQVRREVLREFGLTHGAVKDLKAFDGIYRYLVEEWLRLVTKRVKGNQDKSETDPVWKVIQSATFGERAERAVRRRRQQVPERGQLEAQLRGVMTSYAAAHDVEDAEALVRFMVGWMTTDNSRTPAGPILREKRTRFAMLQAVQLSPDGERIRKLALEHGAEAALTIVLGEEWLPDSEKKPPKG